VRQIFLDTETTGLEPTQGHRMVELAAVEFVNRRPTGNHFHRYLNPERESDERALEIHGLTTDFLQDKPKFVDIMDEFIEYVTGAELIIHNASFDVGFLDNELTQAGKEKLTVFCPQITDTLKMAKDMHPGKRNNLNALCERYQVDNSQRTLHGALLDAQLLGEVYLAMTRGQETLMMEVETAPVINQQQTQAGGHKLMVLRASNDELEAHQTQLDKIHKESKGSCLWQRL
jgi:DNA polymerase III subunit epsilon